MNETIESTELKSAGTNVSRILLAVVVGVIAITSFQLGRAQQPSTDANVYIDCAMWRREVTVIDDDEEPITFDEALDQCQRKS